MKGKKLASRKAIREFVNGSLSELFERFEKLGDSELRMADEYLCSLTTTNCWWLPYEMRHALGQIIESILHTRKVKIERKKQTA